ncbi:CHASE2 domain-containing protein [Laspinema olomoucense]|uniref:CHASE2 domain-containing protein n=1 Tax=Laspinema olomoucense TaxID=3231600 RepID=UPI0021BA9679|nr:CHASE2 domain-containing protein [Laspinema sp. D3a]MCT7988985.1 CHASE2 domain-containing protein [Laspinema sp. D3a]
MAKLVKLSLEGDLTSGYEVELIQISEEERDGKVIIEGIGGKLPPAAEIYECYQTWQQNYEQLDRIYRGGEFRFLGVETNSNVSLGKCQELSETLGQKINDWLDAPGFRIIEDRIRTHLSPGEDIRVLIKTSDYKLWQIPWSAWDFFKTYPNAEVVFSSFDVKYGEKPIKTTRRKNVRILSVFGDAKNINIHPDRQQIERLKSIGADPTPVTEPTVQTLRNLLWNQSWDIFFFAGHGDRVQNATQGKIYLNSEEALTPSEFKNTLKTAIVDRGLKIAFLNSCVGLEFAYELVTDFGIPVVLAMREPIPDGAAQKFLEYFLLEYADHGRPLYVAVRRAKERISEELQTEYPSLEWLPVVCQNPASIPPIWQDLHNNISFKKATTTSLFCTIIVIFIRYLGLLQLSELAYFDLLSNSRPSEEIDKRILVVTVDNNDINYQHQHNMNTRHSLSDEALSQLIEKFLPNNPRLIGLDIYREHYDFEPNLKNKLNQVDGFIAVCKIGETEDNPGSISPPPGIPIRNIGFTDSPDDPDMVSRRHLLGMQSNDICNTSESFNLRVALRYLQNEPGSPALNFLSRDSLQIGQAIFKRLEHNSGGYQLPLKESWGFQVLINYRMNEFEKVSLREVLNGSLDTNLKELVNERIILIGATHSDLHFTPYTRWRRQNKKESGVVIQAHLISQIISAALGERHLIWWWPQWIEFVWIGIWSLAGSLFVWRVRFSVILIIGKVMMVILLHGCCFVLLIKGGWIPIVPCLLVLLLVNVALILPPNLIGVKKYSDLSLKEKYKLW